MRRTAHARTAYHTSYRCYKYLDNVKNSRLKCSRVLGNVCIDKHTENAITYTVTSCKWQAGRQTSKIKGCICLLPIYRSIDLHTHRGGLGGGAREKERGGSYSLPIYRSIHRGERERERTVPSNGLTTRRQRSMPPSTKKSSQNFAPNPAPPAAATQLCRTAIIIKACRTPPCMLAYKYLPPNAHQGWCEGVLA